MLAVAVNDMVVVGAVAAVPVPGGGRGRSSRRGGSSGGATAGRTCPGLVVALVLYVVFHVSFHSFAKGMWALGLNSCEGREEQRPGHTSSLTTPSIYP
jgi:hypothetical protein